MKHDFDSYYNSVILDEKNRFAPYIASALIASTPFAGEVKAEPTTSQIVAQQTQYSRQEQHNIIARTLWAEARNDGELGMDAVASIIYNRGFGITNKMIDAIKAKKQFSCWNGMTQSDWDNFKMKSKSGKEWDIATNIATKIMNGVYNPSHNFDHYFNPQKARPSWGFVDKAKTKLKPHKRIGSHVFMKLGNWVRK